jgi:hypothetical protein
MRTSAVRFGFLIFFGRIVGIARPTRIPSRPMFSDKYLKNWYLLPVGRSAALIPPAYLEGEFAHAGTADMMQLRRMAIPQGRIAEHDNENSQRRTIA